jgi:hypothetical protein
MEKDERQSGGGPEQVAGNREPQRASRPAPGKVTRTSRLASSRGPAVQRKAVAPTPGAGEPQARSAWDQTMDPWMDAAHRGVTALVGRGHDAGPIQAKTEAGTLDPPAQLPGPGGGAEMPGDVRGKMEAAFGTDFSQVRIHEGPQADAVGAQAYTQGTNIHFAPGQYQPGSRRGQELLGHELTHVVQQSQGRVQATAQASGVDINEDASLEREADEMGARAAWGQGGQSATGSSLPSLASPTVQRKVKPEDVSSEMVGQTFELSEAFTSGSTTVKAGDKVKAVAWDNATAVASVTFIPSGSKAVQLDIPKKILRPTHTAVTGMNAYSAGVEGQAAAVDAAEDKLADWTAKEAEYKKAGTTALWTKEKARLESVVQKKTEVLNRKLIQETMFNRFDAVIKREVDAANAAAGFKGADALDPNLMKSMLFQESQLGTAGEHLEVPPSHPVKSRFNLGQVIDSSAMALFTMLEKEQPALIARFKLGTLRTDLAAAQKRRAELQKKASLTAAETAELADLDAKSEQSWEAFIWGYRATGSAVGFPEAIEHFYANVPAGAPKKNLDYEFWIHMAVLWLFEKHKKGMSWADTIRAYNGSGKRAEHYRDAVTKRAADAAAAATTGKDFTPSGI